MTSPWMCFSLTLQDYKHTSWICNLCLLRLAVQFYTYNNAVNQSLQSVVGGPSSLWAVILQSAPAHLGLKGKTACRHLAHTQAATVTDNCAVWNESFWGFFGDFFNPSLAPAGRAAAVRCQSWWWATREICSDSASCRAGQCQSWWRRPGSVATWSALPSLTGMWSCSSKSCWASLWHGACARTTPPSGCRGLYRGIAAPSCDPESSLHHLSLPEWSGSGEKEPIFQWLEIYPVASCFTELIFRNDVY